MRHLIDAIIETYNADGDECEAYEWKIQRVIGGGNGLVYKADKDDLLHKPLAIKISKRDERNRTAREFTAMRGLWWTGIRGISPYPLVFYNGIEGLPGDVVISEWVEGAVLDAYPKESDKQRWTALLSALARVHTATQDRAGFIAPDAVLSIKHPQDAMDFMLARHKFLPDTGIIGVVDMREMDELLANLKKQIPMMWDKPAQQAFTHNDINPRNMIWQHDRMRFVDWEYSGWSDPAQDIADILGREQGFNISKAHRAWIRNKYAQLVGDKNVIDRIIVYEKIFTFMWFVMLTNSCANPRRDKLKGTFQYSDDYFATKQAAYLKRVRELFA